MTGPAETEKQEGGAPSTHPRSVLESVLESPEQIVIFSLDRAYRYTAFNENHRRTMRQIRQSLPESASEIAA